MWGERDDGGREKEMRKGSEEKEGGEEGGREEVRKKGTM